MIQFPFIQCYRYIFSFAIGAGPVTGIIIPELSSTRTRGKIMGFSFSTHWVGTETSSVIFFFFLYEMLLLRVTLHLELVMECRSNNFNFLSLT